MKAILEFDLSNPEINDSVEFAHATNASKMAYLIEEYDQWLRDIIKYNSDKYKSDEVTGMEIAREKLAELIGEEELRTIIFG